MNSRKYGPENTPYFETFHTVKCWTSLYFLVVAQHRSSHSQMFSKIDFLKNIAIFIEKQLCWSLLFNKVAGLRPVTLFKKRLQHWCFPANIVKLLRTPFLYKTPPVVASDNNYHSTSYLPLETH